MIEIRENGRFRMITQKRIHEIKNHSIWISIRGEIKERMMRLIRMVVECTKFSVETKS